MESARLYTRGCSFVHVCTCFAASVYTHSALGLYMFRRDCLNGRCYEYGVGANGDISKMHRARMTLNRTAPCEISSSVTFGYLCLNIRETLV